MLARRHAPLALVLLSVAAQACSGGPPDDPAASTDDALETNDGSHGLVPPGSVESSAPIADAANKPKLTYYGGPVLPHVRIYAVYWGSGYHDERYMNAYYEKIVGSSYLTWLSEYDTPTQKIGTGSFGGAFTIKPGTTKKALDDADVQKELAAQIGQGKLPKPDGLDALYMVNLPPGVTSETGGLRLCADICGYHGTFTRGGKDVFYSVVPDLNESPCTDVCRAGKDSARDDETEVSSHELIESITDAAVGLVASGGKEAWYDRAAHGGEIGDLCAWQPGHVDGFQVQLGWSNKHGKCVDQ
jgi:hypothetical protein